MPVTVGPTTPVGRGAWLIANANSAGQAMASSAASRRLPGQYEASGRGGRAIKIHMTRSDHVQRGGFDSQRIREGQAPKVKVYDKAAPSQRPIVMPTPEVQRTRERAAPVR